MSDSLLLIDTEDADAVHEALDALPDEGTWELVEYAEGIDKAVETLERQPEGQCQDSDGTSRVVFPHNDEVGAAGGGGAQFAGDVESFTVEDPGCDCCPGLVCSATEPNVADVEVGVEVTETVKEISETITLPLGESNVESPNWLHWREGSPNGYVACPRCGSLLSSTLAGTEGEEVKFRVECGLCDWPGNNYFGEDALSAYDLYKRAST